MALDTVRRFDTGKLSKAKKTGQGFLRIPARLTRTGVLEYRRADGSTRYELRLPEEVFNADSLATLAQAPVTDLHPAEMVTPANVKAVMVGVGSETVKQDGAFVASELTITDGDCISAVERGDRKEVSLGYFCKLDMSPGVWQGQRYDAIQRQIRYNHIAIGPEGWGRAGSDVALRLDGQDGATSVDSAVSDVTQECRRDNQVEEIEIKLDGVTVKVSKIAADLIAKEIGRKDGKISELETALGVSETKSKDLQVKLDSASDPKAFQSRVDARVSLVASALKILGDSEKLDGLSTRQIHEKAIAKIQPETKLDGKSDEYVSGVFDFLQAKPEERSDASLAAAREAAEKAKGAPRVDAKNAREEANKRKAEAHKAPLKAHA